MKKNILICLVFSLFITGHLYAQQQKWHIAKSKHFIIYYHNASERLIDDIIDKSEEYYDKIADDLGFVRYDFWLWDNRAKIYIYDDAAAYQSATGQPSWSSGCAYTKDKVIHTFPYAKGFLETILPHELGHIIFREFVGFDNNAVPIWLDEGVACYQEKSRYLLSKNSLKRAIKDKKFLTIKELSDFNPQLVTDSERVNIFYNESVNIVNYLIKEFGEDNFALFCQVLRDKKNLNEALRRAYPFTNIEEMNKAWERYIDG